MECVALGRRPGRPKPGVSYSVWLGAVLCLLATILPDVALSQDSVFLPQIDVIATSPLGGATAHSRRARGPATRTTARPAPAAAPAEEAGIDRDKIAANTQTLTAEDFARTYSPSITDTLMQRVPGVSVTDVQGNGMTQDLRYRGF